MKKYFFTMMTAAMFFASCSNDDTAVPENNGTENQDDLVEIKLGTSSRVGTTVTESRAVEDWDDVTSVGIFMLDKGTAESNFWNDNTATGDNIPAKLVNIEATAGDPDENGKVDLTLTGSPYYYPRTKGRAYNFYGYHPYINTEPTIGETSVTISGSSFTGQEDIMYGYAINEDITAYSAEYFRTIAKAAEEGSNDAEEAMAAARPNIEFNHLTARLKVYLVQGYDYDANNELCQIKDITVELPTTYELEFTKENPEATLTFGDTNEPNSLLVEGIAANAGFITAEDEEFNATTTALIGDVLVPPTEIGEGYEFSIAWNKDGEISPITIALTGQDDDNTNALAFEAGKAYNIIIKINGPKEIEITATIAKWEDGGNWEFEI